MKKTYESPELFELGQAETLTLGCNCSCSDNCCGKESGSGHELDGGVGTN